MRFNSNGKIAQFYHFFQKDGEELPQDFCTYFWGLVCRALFMLVIPGQLAGWIVYGLFLLVRLAWAHKIGALCWIMGPVGIVLLTIVLNKRRKRLRFEFLDEVKMLAVTKIDAVKQHYCPRIEWD